MGNFKRGFVLGSLIGLGAMWLGTTKKGREVRDEIMDHAATIYADLRTRIMATHTWQNFDSNQYTVMVRNAVEDYAKKIQLNDSAKKFIKNILERQWKTFADELKNKKQ